MTTIKDFEDYLIFQNSDIFSIKSNIFLKPWLDGKYYRVDLCKNGKSFTRRIHRLVGLTFIENPEDKPDVDHRDRNTKNNNISNLRWATKSENQQNTIVREANKLGIKNICFDKSKNRYKFKKTINKIKHEKLFKTLELAIIYKENYLELNPTLNF